MNTKLLIHTARKFGTPLYVYDQEVIERQCRALKRHFPGVQIHYAVKANSNPAVLSVIRGEGIGMEAVSPGEIRVGKSAGFKKPEISFTCSNQTTEELMYAAKNAGIVHIDSLVQLASWGKAGLGRDISLRINEGIGAGHHRHVITSGPDSKFGISAKDLLKAKGIAHRYGLRITGLEQHIGSNMLAKDAYIFLHSVRKLLETARMFPDVTHIDFGGGLGIAYKPKERALNLKNVGKEFTKLTHDFEREREQSITFALEPGRFIVGEAGTLLVSVVDKKSTSKHAFVGVNSGFNHLIRPAMYGSHHEIENLSRKGNMQVVTVAGNVCESGDIFATRRRIASPQLGDILAIRNAGAYGMTMASHYNLRALPKEVLVKKGKAQGISFSPIHYIR